MHECISICLIARKIVNNDDVCVAQTITAKLAEAKTHVHTRMQIEMQIRMKLTDTNVTTAVCARAPTQTSRETK